MQDKKSDYHLFLDALVIKTRIVDLGVTIRQAVCDALLEKGYDVSSCDTMNVGFHSINSFNDGFEESHIPEKYYVRVKEILSLVYDKYAILVDVPLPITEDVPFPCNTSMYHESVVNNKMCSDTLAKYVGCGLEVNEITNNVVPKCTFQNAEEERVMALYDRGILPFYTRYPAICVRDKVFTIFSYYRQKFGDGSNNFWVNIFQLMPYLEIRKIFSVCRDSFRAFIYINSEYDKKMRKHVALVNVENILNGDDDDAPPDLFCTSKLMVCTASDSLFPNRMPTCFVHNKFGCKICSFISSWPVEPFTFFLTTMDAYEMSLVVSVTKVIKFQGFSCDSIYFRGFSYAPLSVFFCYMLELIKLVHGGPLTREVFDRFNYGICISYEVLYQWILAIEHLSRNWWFDYVNQLDAESYYRYGESYPRFIDILLGHKRRHQLNPIYYHRVIVPIVSRTFRSYRFNCSRFGGFDYKVVDSAGTIMNNVHPSFIFRGDVGVVCLDGLKKFHVIGKMLYDSKMRKRKRKHGDNSSSEESEDKPPKFASQIVTNIFAQRRFN